MFQKIRNEFGRSLFNRVVLKLCHNPLKLSCWCCFFIVVEVVVVVIDVVVFVVVIVAVIVVVIILVVIVVEPNNLHIKFGQNRVSNS